MPVEVLLDAEVELALLPLLALDDEIELDSRPPAPVVDDAVAEVEVPLDVDAVLMTTSPHAKGQSKKHRTLTTSANGRSVLCFIGPVYLSRSGQASTLELRRALRRSA